MLCQFLFCVWTLKETIGVSYVPILCRKRKVREIEEVNRPAGVGKWKKSKSKGGKGNGKKRRH